MNLILDPEQSRFMILKYDRLFMAGQFKTINVERLEKLLNSTKLRSQCLNVAKISMIPSFV